MDENTPIKRHPAMVSFSKDHHFGLLLVWKIRQGIKKEVSSVRISNYVLHFFEIDLKQHFQEEEQLLFPKLPAGNPLRQKAEEDHRKILQLLNDIAHDKGNLALLNRMALEVEAHIRFEERELFGYLQAHMGEKELEALLSRAPINSYQAADQWEDVFWEK
ncbi:MAG: hemerythrin domain-containing protein [Bacteroidota bacterium]|nr:hemerythrin domain-containing protein [Bacteroidota bacterium]